MPAYTVSQGVLQAHLDVFEGIRRTGGTRQTWVSEPVPFEADSEINIKLRHGHGCAHSLSDAQDGILKVGEDDSSEKVFL